MSRTIVITGASSGIGRAAAEQFAAAGDHVVLVGRTPARLEEAARRIPGAAQFRADFEDLDQVRGLAAALRDAYPRIDVLASNAGGMVADYRRTRDGFEATMQGNHLGPFLLAGLLHDRVGRMVVTASRAHMRGDPDPDGFAGDPARYSSWRAYSDAKAANIMFAAEAARRWPDVTSVSFHPGVVRSNFGAGAATRFFYRVAPFLVPPEKAGAILVRLATGDVVDGAYYDGDKLRRPTGAARDPVKAARLWDASAEATGLEK